MDSECELEGDPIIPDDCSFEMDSDAEEIVNMDNENMDNMNNIDNMDNIDNITKCMNVVIIFCPFE